jgi:hypothetical protein
VIFRRIAALPTPGYGCNRAWATAEKLSFTISYECDDEETDGTVVRKVAFRRVVAYTFHDEAHAHQWAKETFDAVAEADDSDWLETLKAKVPTGRSSWPFERHHYVICLRNHGCYEVVAESVTLE